MTFAVGTKIDAGAVKLVRWARDSVPQGAFTDPQAIAGSFAKSEFVAGEPMVASKLFMGQMTSGVMPLLIPAGMRAMSVPVDEVSDIAGFVEPHTRVDVLVAVAGTGPGEPSFSRIVLQDIEVLAVAQEIEHVKDQPEVVKVVTLLVTPPDAEKLTLASREGLLRLAMRNYSDNKIVATRGIGLPDLLHRDGGLGGLGSTLPVTQIQPAPAISARPAHGPTAFRIEVMRDGKSSEAMSFVHSGMGGGRSSYQAHEEDRRPNRSRRCRHCRHHRTRPRLNRQSRQRGRFGPRASPNRRRVHSRRCATTQSTVIRQPAPRRSDRAIRATCRSRKLIRFHERRWLQGGKQP